MKKTCTVVFVTMVLLSLSYLSAQTTDTSVATATNTIFAPLEKNRIPHNILLDYGIEFIDITKYDGVLRTDNYVDNGVYKDTYSTLVSSCTATNVPGIVAPMTDELAAKSGQKSKNTTSKGTSSAQMLLSGLYYNYSRFRSDALSGNRITVVNNTYDDKYINGVWQNPYETKTAFVISTPILELNKATLSLSLPSTLWHTNQASTISNIEVDFGSGGGYKTLFNNAVASNTYTSTGVYALTYRLRLTNGSYLYSRQKLKVNNITSTTTSKGPLPIAQQNITATRSYLNIAGSATLQIAYGGTDTKIRKPLIVAEGFDTGLLAASGSIGDSDYRTFQNQVNQSLSPELRNLITNNTSVDYDVVYVNWDNGTDYIQRNAYVLQEVIKWVNTQKAAAGSTTPNVILGQSMGGIIARYALKDMENRGEQHKTGLYISHDAPHQGANVPIGFLYMARHVVNQYIKSALNVLDIPISSGGIGVSDIQELLDAPATRQLLINNVNNNFAVDNSLRTSFQNELKTIGYPAQTRNIALSNASHCASAQSVTAGSQIFKATADGKTTFLTDILLALLTNGGNAATIIARTTNEPGFLLGILPGRSKINSDFRVIAYPASGTAQVYYGKVRYTKNLLWVLPISKDITFRTYNSPSGQLPLDSYPGGVNPSFSGANSPNINSYISNALIKYGFTVNLNPNFNFISATSALDVGRNNTTLVSSDYLAKYSSATPPTGGKAVPFVNFSTSYNNSGTNESHISFNARNGKWLASEMDAVSGSDTFDCSFSCSSQTIAGSTSICTTGTYSVSVPAGTTVNWAISPSSAATFPSGSSSSKTFTKSSSFNGNATITATISNSVSNCQSITVSKQITLGGVINLTAPNGADPNGTITVSVSGGTGSYSWYKNGTLFATTGGGSGIMLQWGCSGGLLKVVANTSCGQAEVTRTLYQDCGSSSMTVYPNPTSSEIFIEQVPLESTSSETLSISQSQSKSATADSSIVTEIYDFSGTLLRTDSFKISDDMPRIDVSELKQGTYFLRIISKNVDEVHQIIKE